jgi:nucleoside-diphosphate-sugar epimerase
VTEQSELRGQTENQGLLIQTENILRGLESRERPVCIFRLGEIYGPGRDIATRLKALQGTQLRGDGQNLTNLIHRDDCVGALAYAMRHGLRGTYNLCGETHVTRQQLYDRICDAAQLGRLGWDGSASSQHGGRRQLSTHALQEKGYKFRHKFFEREGLVIE